MRSAHACNGRTAIALTKPASISAIVNGSGRVPPSYSDASWSSGAGARGSVAATLASTRRGKAALLRFGEGLWLLSATKSFTRGAFAWRDERASRDRLGRRLLRTTGRSNASYGARYRLRREAITPAHRPLTLPADENQASGRRAAGFRIPRRSETRARRAEIAARGVLLAGSRTRGAIPHVSQRLLTPEPEHESPVDGAEPEPDGEARA